MRAIRRFSVRTVLPEPIAALGELASNLRWSWHPPTCDLFAALDPDRWLAVGGDPVSMLGALSPEELEALAADPQFVARVSADRMKCTNNLKQLSLSVENYRLVNEKLPPLVDQGDETVTGRGGRAHGHSR